MSNRTSGHYFQAGQKDHNGKNDKTIYILET